MAQTAAAVSKRFFGLLSDPTGVPFQLALLRTGTGGELPPSATVQVSALNAAPEVIEKTGALRYPGVSIYCERISNTLREKFRAFSGKARMAVEARVSQDRLEGLEDQLQQITEAVLAVLDSNRGDLGDGVFFPGAYEVTYGAVRHGGKNYIQTAKVVFEVEISKN